MSLTWIAVIPSWLRGVEDIANRLLADRAAPPVGINWASKFVKRHGELSARFTRRYDYQWAKCEDPKRDLWLVSACTRRSRKIWHPGSRLL